MFVRDGKLFKMPSNAYRTWHKEACTTFLGNRKSWPATERVEITFFLPDKRRTDLTNKAESIMDLLVDNGVLQDDCVEVVPELTLKLGGYDKVAPRAVINIYGK